MIPKQKCLYCDHDLWDDNPPYQPDKGCYSICAFCGEVMIFDEKIYLIIPKSIPDDIKLKSMMVKLALRCGVNVQEKIKERK